jgi:hypothetical protein
MQGTVGSGQWIVYCGQITVNSEAVDSRQWIAALWGAQKKLAVYRKQWVVYNGHFTLGSGRKAVESKQWTVFI